MTFPRYFVASVDDGTAATIPTAVEHALDVFVIQCRGAAREWVVGLGDDGKLTAQPVEPRIGLQPAVQAQLTFHEAAGQPSRPLAVESLYLFEAHLLAHAPDLPGINDPIYMDGTLVGPLTTGNERLVRRTGKLTVTRGDILHGLVVGAAAPFLHADTATGRTARTFHAFLPGDRREVLRQGHGGVLAYPSMGLPPALVGSGNEPLVDEILCNVLRAVWSDVAREHPPPLREPDDVPVPSRSVHEMQLVSEGFTIKGNRAVRKGPGRLGWLFGVERRRLPLQGNTKLFLSLAKEALELLPWPLPRITALTGRPPTRPGPPAAAAPPGAASQSSEVAWDASAAWREDWIRRFTEAQDRRRKLQEEAERPADDER